MKELLLYVAKNLVDHPDAVRVIGRQGRIAKEIRTIVKTVAQRNGERITVDIVD